MRGMSCSQVKKNSSDYFTVAEKEPSSDYFKAKSSGDIVAETVRGQAIEYV